MENFKEVIRIVNRQPLELKNMQINSDYVVSQEEIYTLSEDERRQLGNLSGKVLMIEMTNGTKLEILSDSYFRESKKSKVLKG